MKRGRPKLPEGESKDATLTFRVQPEERDALQAAADAAGLSLSDWMRATLVAKAFPKEITTTTSWHFAGGKVRLETRDMNHALWLQLKAFVELINPGTEP